MQHDDVEDAFVTCMTTKDHAQILTAYIIRKNKDAKNNASELSDFLSERLPNYMVPISYIFLDRFPLKVNGKIDRAQLIEYAATPVPQEA
jgi:acyl-CoA synthetase (AMP-forming)/AMP-acid ligase II